MVDKLDLPAKEFSEAAALPPPRRSVTIDIDADLLNWIEQGRGNVATEVNGLLRFVMDTTKQQEEACDPDVWEPGEMIEPPAP